MSNKEVARLCPHDETKLKIQPESIDIFGPGTYVLVCPTCHKVDEGCDSKSSYTIPKSERTLILRGIEAQIKRAHAGQAPKRWCTCPKCETILWVEDKPPTGIGSSRVDGEEVIAYMYVRDREKVCTCYKCGHVFHVFENAYFKE